MNWQGVIADERVRTYGHHLPKENQLGDVEDWQLFLEKGKKFDYNISSYEAGRYCEISFGRMHTVSVRYLAEKGKDYERTESK